MEKIDIETGKAVEEITNEFTFSESIEPYEYDVEAEGILDAE